MARPRSEVTIAMLEVFGGQSEPMTWRTVAEELARRGVIGAALAPGDLRLLHRAVGEAYRRGELVNVGVARGIPGQTRPPVLYRLRKEGDPPRKRSEKRELQARAIAELLKAWS
ncbi:hypothetical protein HZU83_20775 [Sphaerotilus montanus]|uniref:Uncharacterized protein n=1 Tax=Sphaerotilus montanus TaxID=522889 RepID=A0A7Y9QXK9_9BURK|nr:hypothetical protein [Sphaerotilus montanus]NYG31643.1 hypothetical protein [Sphaerotilus montanus]NZD59118.1 hypothetical protein [Sphaerotilus montanus]